MEQLQLSFQKGAGELRHSPLTRSELEVACPVAFTSAPTHPTCSDRYSVLRTIDIIDMVATYGWLPVSARQTGKGPNPKRSLHMVVFENPEMVIQEGTLLTGLPRLILVNSLDGFTKLQFMCGIYRFVCSNGLVLSDTEFGRLKVKHANTTVDAVNESIKAILAQMEPYLKRVERMYNTILSPEVLMAFVLAALAIRIKFKVPRTASEDATIADFLSVDGSMLLPLHEADEGRTDLWYHFNNVQERMMKGKFEYKLEGKDHSLRSINGLSRDLEFNQKLFQLASSYTPEQ